MLRVILPPAPSPWGNVSWEYSQGRWSIFRVVCRSMVVSASCCNLVVGVVGVAASWSVLQSRGRHGFCCKIMVGDVSVADPWSTWFLLQNHGRLHFFLQNHGWRQYLLQIHGRVYFCCSTMVANYFWLQHHGRLRARTNTCSFLFNHPREDFTLLSYPYFLCYRDPIYLHVNLISLPFKVGKAHVLCLKVVYSSCVPQISHSNNMNNVATYPAVIVKIAWK